MADSNYSMEETRPMFYIGEHETKRPLPVTAELVHHAQDLGYDMLTTPITNDHFHSRVLSLLSSYTHATEGSTQAQPLPLIPALEDVDTPLVPDHLISQLIAFTSSWIDLGSSDPVIAHLSQQVFNYEVAYAAFCGVVTLVVPGPRAANGTNGVAQYARAIKEALAVGAYVQLHILMPVDYSRASEEEDLGNLARFVRPEYAQTATTQANNSFAAWDAWNSIRTICKYNSRLSVALDLPKKLPSLALQSRWYSEPVRLLILSAKAFIPNEKGSWVLHKTSQLFIMRCMRLKTTPWLLLADIGPIPGVDDPEEQFEYSGGYLSPAAAADAPSPGSSVTAAPTPAEAAQIAKKTGKKSSSDPTPYLSYMRYMQRNQPPSTQLERFGDNFQDYLQSPLQPLADNLESITYEVFEKDPIKYAWYEEAIARALEDWRDQQKSTSSEDGAVVIAVVGSGRGPLVTRALNASLRTGVPVRVYAIEKNPNAYVVLLGHNKNIWGGQVTVVKTDMRAWKGPVRPDGTSGNVDILVSELLGSFADNELSPECLDGVQHVLNPDHGISIPASYTAHMTPIATPKLYADVYSRATHGGDASAFEIPWVVMFSQFDYLSVQPNQPHVAPQLSDGRKMRYFDLSPPLEPLVHTAWEFTHPQPPTVLAQSSLRRGGSAVGGGGGLVGGDGANEHNFRHCKVTYPIQEQGVCHGLAGYFETVLYSGSQGPVELSTNPVTMDAKSKDMISWFPIFFPLKTPIHLPSNSELEVSMWRQTDDRKVWYEWLVEAFTTIGGQRIRLGTSDLHSSKSNGCLM
ncbi:hypothetical protein SLS60_007272 [Paraconiothyrium brasiliense]|uniref:Protein arginine N-methyltransferase n=1 Tax=Paraconiothyrium brasiliense TaxID=300254 RepID=A0ABR3R4V9_9PLEO